jgi:acyl carrier protein
MNRSEFLRALDELFDQGPGTFRGDEALASLPMWDSIQVLRFIALVDEKLGVPVDPEAVAKCKTIGDLVAVCGEAVAPN